MSGMNSDYFDSEIFKVLGEEARIDILNILGKQELNVSEIADKVKISRPTVSHHMQILKRAGVVFSRREGKEIYYSVNMTAFTSLARVILGFVNTGKF
ncbi:metalloregulator ArsR/SmtB family transcription factor [Sinanaerobacter sp. ZZT-01]|uniref:ArsR/SmtB family transcription factor n=1 Tax=Sinanaerobacter sp. ZZT-01 TaxID=3111540 RepID=UPI002D7A02B8|nr:metalloregulator ArsR/SmtB family transcription factor [Sinanaerobacter sp. ZZT-01]WRR94963.1 metalloregulator ArsR/SmtB family transcription factor [Sinanaerobacter sp. ZZT-01]